MINQNLKILHTASFFHLNSYCSVPALTTINENNSSYLCSDDLEWRKLIIILCSTEKQYFEILVYHENLMTISFTFIILSIELFLVWQRN